MHWVDRGSEPAGLDSVRSRYTSGWVDHYRHGTGPRPGDSRWRDFKPDLSSAFSGLCGYCEELCSGEVDHFRPKSRFPELVYQWSNWVLACHDCNLYKSESWPARSYVDPCARSSAARPEAYFDLDLATGDVVPRPGLSDARREKARRMIDGLHLNVRHHQQARLEMVSVISRIFALGLERNPEMAQWLRERSDRSRELSTVVRTILTEYGFVWNP